MGHENSFFVPAGDVCEHVYFLQVIKYFLAHPQCGVRVATVSFAPLCLGAHFHNPPVGAGLLFALCVVCVHDRKLNSTPILKLSLVTHTHTRSFAKLQS